MNTTTLADLMKNVTSNTPYTKSLKVMVVTIDNMKTYRTDKGEEKKYLHAAVADSTQAMKVTCFDSSKFSRFVEGSSIYIRQFIKKEDCIIVNSQSKVFPSPQAIEVTEELKQKAQYIIRPPAAPFQPLDQALRSPTKTRISIKGKIVQEEEICDVTIRNNKVQVKAIVIQDITSKAKCSLWREFATTPAKLGDFVSITNVVLNTYRNESTFSTTQLTTIQNVDAPKEVKKVDCVGVCFEDLTCTLLLIDDTELEVPMDKIEAAFPDVEKEHLEHHITKMCQPSVSLKVTYSGTEVDELEID